MGLICPLWARTFNSRPRVGIDLLEEKAYGTEESFNSRPHKEVDLYQCGNEVTEHDFQLTTSRGGRLDGLKSIGVDSSLSTHDLAWRSPRTGRTTRGNHKPFNSRPRVEVDGDFVGAVGSLVPFNSRPRVEVDRRRNDQKCWLSSFNSRPHVEVDDSRSGVHP